MNYVLSFYYPFHEVAIRSWLALSVDLFTFPVFIIFAASFVLILLMFKKRGSHDVSLRRAGIMVLLGFVFFMIGAFPYLAVGQLTAQPYDSLMSRYELLLPIGAGFIMYYALQWLFAAASRVARLRASRAFPLSRILIVSFIIAMFVTVNFVSYLQFQRDWYRQLSLIDNFRSSQVVRTHTSFVFADHALWLNAYGRDYHFYEYTSMMKYAFGGETRYGCSIIGEPYHCNAIYLTYSIWNFRDYKPIAAEYVCNIYDGPFYTGGPEDNARTLWLLYLEFFNPHDFRATVDTISAIQCSPASGSYY
jgi:hypothetical protein